MKYLVETHNESGEWVTGGLTRVFIFEAESNKIAQEIVANHFGDNPKLRPVFLAQLTQGLAFQEIQLADHPGHDIRHRDGATTEYKMEQIVPDKRILDQFA